MIGGDVSTIVYFICSNRIPTTINTNFSRTKEKKESLAHFINSSLRETKQTKKRSSKLESPFPLLLPRGNTEASPNLPRERNRWEFERALSVTNVRGEGRGVGARQIGR